MKTTLNQLFNLAQSTSGRRILAFRQVRSEAVRLGFTALIPHIDEAIAHERQTREYETLWSGSKRTRAYSAELSDLDRRLDNVLTSIRDIARSQTRGAPAGDPIIDQVENFLTAVFPGGVQTMTALPYIEEIAAVEGAIRKLRGPLARTVDDLGLARQVKRLVEIATAYRRELEEAPPPVTFKTVRAHRDRGQHYLLEVAAMIAGTYFRLDDADHQSRRDKLLAPIMAQEQAIRAKLRARRSVPDIDPDTGEDIDTPGDDAPIGAPIGAPGDAPGSDDPRDDAPIADPPTNDEPGSDPPASDPPASDPPTSNGSAAA